MKMKILSVIIITLSLCTSCSDTPHIQISAQPLQTTSAQSMAPVEVVAEVKYIDLNLCLGNKTQQEGDKLSVALLPDGFVASGFQYKNASESYRIWYDLKDDKGSVVGSVNLCDRESGILPFPNHVKDKQSFSTDTVWGKGDIYTVSMDSDAPDSEMMKVIALIPVRTGNNNYYICFEIDAHFFASTEACRSFIMDTICGNPE